ncbi:class I SAM-dependent methyltransferase [Luteolibacter pohnpeiensis]|uniref:Class I SAM-dependent methyltransferase n=1 Tax=Luteolibacter pohnpeiensis TaxID=454153 RepID=A0A934S5M8_9BACT|nr:class I SAM-dependent methyltransferase [Luteolibacter pohnpeiensis]MBK1881206.1 class I SAM-dependent methyltransferase [Luteolibacter pohnpeiensis]
MIQRTALRFPGTDEDVARLRILLTDALRTADFQASGRLAVLNLACGRADESGALAAAVTPAEIGFYLGIDLRPDAIEEAASRWHLADGEIEFICGDASATHRMKQLPPVDLVFIRHQNYWSEPAVWDRLLGNALAALKPDGVLVLTSYFDVEHDLMIAALKTRGAVLVANLRHFKSRPLSDAPGKSVDRHLAVFRRSGERTFLLGSGFVQK